jgi:hypothetical protein
MSWSCCFHVRNVWEGLELMLAEATKEWLDRSSGEGMNASHRQTRTPLGQLDIASSAYAKINNWNWWVWGWWPAVYSRGE